MNRKLKLGMCIAIALLSLSNNFIFAQFNNFSGGYYNTFAPVTAIGVGTNPTINSAFQIDGRSVFTPTGNVFSSQGFDNVDNLWQMFTGNANSVTEKGRIFTTPNWTPPTLNTDFNIKATQGSLFLYSVDASNNNYHVIVDSLNDYVGIGDFGYNGRTSSRPQMPLHIVGDAGNKITSSGWNAGLFMDDYSIIVWNRGFHGWPRPTPDPNYFLMGCPTYSPRGDCYFGTTHHLGVGCPANYCYRVIGDPTLNTPPDTNDIEFFSTPTVPYSHNVLVDGCIGVHLNDGVTPLYTPTNQVEINTTASITNPVPPTLTTPNGNSGAGVSNGFGGKGFSGLRFTDLRAGVSTPYTSNPGTGVLAVDRNGDVIYVPDNTGGFGLCPSLTPLTSDAGINLSNNNLLFEGQGGSSYSISGYSPPWFFYKNNIGIGYACGEPLYGKLSVNQTAVSLKYQSIYSAPNYFSIAGYFNNTVTPPSPTVLAEYGIYSIAEGNSAFINCGVYGAASGTINNANYNYGGAFYTNTLGAYNYGIRADAPANPISSTTPPNATTPYLAGLFNGDVFVVGNFAAASDARLKINIDTMKSALKAIRNLTPINYDFDTLSYPSISLPRGRQIGFTSQEVQNIFPNMVREYVIPPKYDSTGTMIYDSLQILSLNYIQLIPVAIRGIKDLDKITTGLLKRMDTLKAPANNGLSVSNDTIQLGGSPLVHNTELPLNNNTFSFIDPTSDSTSNNHVNIGGNDSIYSNPLLANLPYKLGIFDLTEANGEVIGALDNTSTAPQQNMLYIYHGGLSNAQTLYGSKILIDSGATGKMATNVGLNSTIQNSLAIKNYGIQSNVKNIASTYNYGLNTTAGGGLYNYGINATAQNGNDTASTNYGISTTAKNGLYNYGIYSTASGGTINYGGQFNASSKTNTNVANIGIWATASGGAINCAIYGEAIRSSDSTPPIGPNYAGYFNGDVVRTGTDNFSSDSILKRNIKPFKNALNIIKQLRPRTFEFKTNKYPYLGLASGNQYGFIAQEVEPLLPVLVKNVVHPAKVDTLGNIIRPALHYKAINYQGFIPILIEGIKELSANKDSINTNLSKRIDSLINVDVKQNVRFDSLKNANETRFDTLESIINRCCSNKNDKTINQNNNDNNDQNQTPSIHNIELANNAILYQNAPNPFGNGTIIKYFVPDYTDAQIVFYDEFGNQLKKYNIEEKGMGQLNVDASNLSSGMYSYSLVVNGKVIDSKKMICSK